MFYGIISFPAEVLQGIRADKDFIKTREYLGGLVFLTPASTKRTFCRGITER